MNTHCVGASCTLVKSLASWENILKTGKKSSDLYTKTRREIIILQFSTITINDMYNIMADLMRYNSEDRFTLWIFIFRDILRHSKTSNCAEIQYSHGNTNFHDNCPKLYG